MKKVVIIVWVCVALLSSFIYGTPNEYITDKQLQSSTLLMNALNKMAEDDKIINDIFKPSKQGHLGSGSIGIIYKGTLHYPHSDEIQVAMKFTHFKDKKYAEKEYEIYSYLDAIDKPERELYGIPTVYYYGTWRCTVIMAISLLDSEFNEKTRDLNVLDALIVCKEFVRISKYIHSCGVYHRDTRLLNIMFRRSNGFIIDYNIAEKMYNTSTLDTSSIQAGKRAAKEDWRMFIWSICSCLRIEISYFLRDKQCTMATMEHFKNIKYKELGRVFFEMGKLIVRLGTDASNNNDNNSSYDHVYEFIEREIDEYQGEKPKMVHWLTNEERIVAKQEIETIPSMSSIPDPLKLAEMNYPHPDPDYFHDKILRLKGGTIAFEELSLQESVQVKGNGELKT